ncbi:MAG: pyruvate, phosphate dikinase [SAR324 cluster bacterium]|nr:pyruvate, phosphate dikinase [SAR324 cluster bacterium]MBL7034666.1 pyruvate, phosphate dikinase [SAR324 cluster bacterium]
MQKSVWLFSEGRSKDNALLGNKGANLCEMTALDLPVPFGFIISTETCNEFNRLGKQLPDGVMLQVMQAITEIEVQLGKKFGDPLNPLLISVRSGAAVSMPGMMDTILNLGLNDEICAGLSQKTNNPRFAIDTYRRFLQMYGDVTQSLGNEKYESVLAKFKTDHNYTSDLEMRAEDWNEIVESYKKIFQPPEAPHVQLEQSIKAVFSSWNNPRAVRYRSFNNIPDNLGTAVIVQAMVFGNMGKSSGSGVAFTRNPATGEKRFYGEYLMNAAGEDVVAGTRTPQDLEQFNAEHPDLYEKLFVLQEKLELHYREMQDLEFTVEEQKLYLLQTRTGKRTAKASVKIAVDMVNEGLIRERAALKRIEPERMNYFLHPMIDPDAEKNVIAKGLPASPGAVTGQVVFSSEEAETLADKGFKVILVRKETTPEDIHGMKASEGILTSLGGMTSHAAVVARGMGKCGISGCTEITVDYKKKEFRTTDNLVVRKKQLITLDGSSGEVMLGDVKKIQAQSDDNFQTILKWADEYRRLDVRANAETPEDVLKARELGAEGIGLCRTEHMFFEEDRIAVMRAMILAKSEKERQTYLDRLFNFQKADFREIFKIMDGLPVTIRLIDPPLHEFLPQQDADLHYLAKILHQKESELRKKISNLSEANPMLGFRGCRLSIVYPGITQMQVRAILTAAIECKQEGITAKPEIMIPLIATATELKLILATLEETAKEVFKQLHNSIDYQFGTMMEVPRACVQARTIAPNVSFMSFGTNDLTQMTYGFSRDDIGTFLPSYLEKKILPHDPFVTLDQQGVGSLIRTALKQSRSVNKKINFGICGEHGGDPRSIAFFHQTGFDYVSCSPFRIPIAKIAAAQASY